MDGTCPPASGLGHLHQQRRGSQREVEEAATSDSGSTRAGWDGLSSERLELRVRGIYNKSLRPCLDL